MKNKSRIKMILWPRWNFHPGHSARASARATHTYISRQIEDSPVIQADFCPLILSVDGLRTRPSLTLFFACFAGVPSQLNDSGQGRSSSRILVSKYYTSASPIKKKMEIPLADKSRVSGGDEFRESALLCPVSILRAERRVLLRWITDVDASRDQ
jgi:hypothetical protein